MQLNTSFKIIVKRDGEIEQFNPSKITKALVKAGSASKEFNESIAQSLTLRVVNLAQQLISDHIPTVEEIQDIVEEVLLSSIYKKSAKSYILYRDKHSQVRQIASKFNVNLVDQYLQKHDWKVNENSNMSFSLQGLNNYISSEISKMYWLNNIYPNEIKELHTNGDFHIHDLGLLSVYCVGWDLFDVLTTGFCGAEGKVESAPAKHLQSALGQIVNFFYTLQGEAAGAQAFSHFDTLLAPFIRFDNLSYKEVKQALQEFLFNMNVPTRVGFQTPFTNITMDLTVPNPLKNNAVIIGGVAQDITYSDFQKEMDMFNRAFLEVMSEGDAKGRIFTFPIPTYNITKDFDWNNQNIDLLWETTAKYGFPYFANFINSEMSPDDVRSMCCRLRIDNRELAIRGGGLFGAHPLTGSIGVVTINMPRIALHSNTKDEFFQRLEELMEQAKISLELKRKVLEKFTDQNLYPYARFYLRNVKQRYNNYWQNHFSTIGLIGMNEACTFLLKSDLASLEGKHFTTKVLNFMRHTLMNFQEETGHLYNLEATPAESTSYRLAQLDKENTFPFYTNSSHLPVDYSEDVFEVLDHQNDLQTKYTGGTVFHMFIGEKIDSGTTVKNTVKTIFEKYQIPYLTITPTFSICPKCGYLSGEQNYCPDCKSTCEVYSRVVGYFRPVNQWNTGKQKEYIMRKTYSNIHVHSSLEESMLAHT